MKYIIALYGKSASGKDFIMNKLAEDFGIQKIISDTTRPPREGEVDGREYYFISPDEFSYKLLEDEYLEHRSYNTVHGVWLYGKNKSRIPENVPTISIFDIEGIKRIARYGDVKVYPIWIDAPGGVRLQRSIERCKSVDYQEIYRRLMADERDFNGHFYEVATESCKDKYGFNPVIIENIADKDYEVCRDYVETILRDIKECVDNNK